MMKSKSTPIIAIVCLVVLVFGIQATIQSMAMQDGQQSENTRKVIQPDKNPRPGLPFSPGILVGDTLYIAGHLGRDPETRKLVEGGIEPETRQVMANIRRVLKAAGMEFEHVVSVTAYIADINDFPKFNEAYREYFPTDPPTRATVQVAALSGGAQVELQMIAVKP